MRGLWLALNRGRGVKGPRPKSTRLRRFCHTGLLRSSQASEAQMGDHGDGLSGTGFTKAGDYPATALGNREITLLYLGTRISGV